MRRSSYGLEIRSYVPADADDLVAVALRACEPVFDSLRSVLGSEVFISLRGEDWRQGRLPMSRRRSRLNMRARGLRWSLASAEPLRLPCCHLRRSWARSSWLPSIQATSAKGLATALAEAATDWLREQGATTAMVETGGDAGHAAARATYQSAGCRALPVTRYFKTL
jgi:GNAT superfamily N-acetyltransferase